MRKRPIQRLPRRNTGKNIEALAKMLDESDEYDLSMKTETFRELGEFESAKSYLGRVTSKDYGKAVRQFRLLIDAEDIIDTESCRA